ETRSRARTTKGAAYAVVAPSSYQRVVPAVGVNGKHHARVIAVAAAHVGQINTELVAWQCSDENIEIVESGMQGWQHWQDTTRPGDDFGGSIQGSELYKRLDTARLNT